jgi:hypothetical protein
MGIFTCTQAKHDETKVDSLNLGGWIHSKLSSLFANMEGIKHEQHQ